MVTQFTWCGNRKFEVNFEGGAITSDGGALLLREADRKLGLMKNVSKRLADGRRQASCQHKLIDLFRQRVYGIALGYEDLNDHETLRGDPNFQAALGRNVKLASMSTLCRFENSVNRDVAVAIHEVLMQTLIQSFKTAPKELVLDFDATNDQVHGEQEGRFFSGFYRHYCFLPLHVYCGDQLLVSYLRASNQDPAQHSGAVLRLLVNKLRAVWPEVRIIFRGDSGFCRPRTLSWCERNNVKYIVGIAKNKRLLAKSAQYTQEAESRFLKTERKQRLFSSFKYAARSWKTRRKILLKAEHGEKGANPRFVVTNVKGKSKELYEELYCARGEMENRIKETQLHLFSDRTSCHDWWANQMRLLLSSLAYVLVDAVRRIALKGTELSRAQASTIRLKLFKIGAVVIRNTKRIKLIMSSYYPYQKLFWQVAHKLTAT